MGLTPGELLEPFTSKRLIRLDLTPGSTHDVMQSPYGSSASHEKEGSPNNSHAAQGIPLRILEYHNFVDLQLSESQTKRTVIFIRQASSNTKYKIKLPSFLLKLNSKSASCGENKTTELPTSNEMQIKNGKKGD